MNVAVALIVGVLAGFVAGLAGKRLVQVLLQAVVTGWLVRPPTKAPGATAPTIEHLQRMDPADFERAVKDLFVKADYRDRHHRPGPGDRGVDLDLDAPNGERAIVQCKRFKAGRKVHVGDLRDLIGAANDFNARQAFFVTSSTFTRDARLYASRTDVILIDGPQLIELLHGPRGALQELVRRQSNRLQLKGSR